MRRVLLMACVLGAGAVAVWAQGTGTAPATAPATQRADGASFSSEEQLSALFRDGKYSDVLHETGRILNVPAVLGRYNEFNLQLLRAECYLQLRNVRMAVQTFELAGRVSRDAGKSSLMRATAMAVQRSVGLKYVAKNTDENGDPWLHPGERHDPVRIDLLALGERTAALKALYADQWFMTRAAVEQARHSTAMDGYTQALKDLEDLAVAEEAVVGKEEATQKLREQAAGEMNETIQNALADMKEKTEKLNETAGQSIVVHVPSAYVGNDGVEHSMTLDRVRARGLTEGDARWLEGVRATSAQVPIQTQEYAQRLHVEKGVFSKSVEDAAALAKRVNEVLTRNTVYRGFPFGQ
ncbi:MAG: hypothetical protein ACTHN5_04795 [Phycisphaerae bacterium]